MPDNNENIVHITAMDGLTSLIGEEMEQLKPTTESQNYERDAAWKSLNYWRKHDLQGLRKAFE